MREPAWFSSPLPFIRPGSGWLVLGRAQPLSLSPLCLDCCLLADPTSPSPAMSIPQPTKDSVQDTIEDGPTRYAAFAMRLRTLITASSRCESACTSQPGSPALTSLHLLPDVAYSSDIGEAFRPLTNPLFVRAAYGISWSYM